MHYTHLIFEIAGEFIDPRCSLMVVTYKTSQYNSLYLAMIFSTQIEDNLSIKKTYSNRKFKNGNYKKNNSAEEMTIIKILKKRKLK